LRHPKKDENYQLLKNLIPKLEQQDPRKWDVRDLEGHEGTREPCRCARIYYINLDSPFRVELARYIQESKNEYFNYYVLSVWERGGREAVVKFTSGYSSKIEKLYSKIDKEVRKYKKSSFEVKQEQEMARQQQEEKNRQESLKRFKKQLGKS